MIYVLVFLLVVLLMVLLPKRNVSLFLTGIVTCSAILLTSWLSIAVLTDMALPQVISERLDRIIGNELICFDNLSAIFVLIINFTCATGFIYSVGYLKPYLKDKPELWIKLHYLSLFLLYASMLFVVLFKNGFYFLIAWELMTLSSFLLVIFEFRVKGTLQAGLNYLVQMHVGMLFLLFALIITSEGKSTLSFGNLHYYFGTNPNWPVFLIFFIGFGLKAGFVLLHTWLPEAHPAAPSHVSGIMSGVMIKMGIYGILRVCTYLQSDLYTIGAIMIIISAVTGLYGVMMAILQHDIKKLLAYHSIENIGIIGIGIGLGLLGTALGNNLITIAGYAGAILHSINHSLFKSLLFYSAGSVITNTHTRNIENMGGLIRYMPVTALLFLIGSVAICGLPPFNGFVSEYLIYFSLFSGIGSSDFYPLLIFTLAMVSLVLIGGLAIFCFTKVFSIVFLGQSRIRKNNDKKEVSAVMLAGKILPAIPVFVIGFAPVLIVLPLFDSLSGIFVPSAVMPDTDLLSAPLSYISVAGILLVALTLVLWFIKKITERNYVPERRPTWGCGYTAVDARQQYTATSFAQEYARLTRPLIRNGASKISFRNDEVFPGERDFHSSSSDWFRSKVVLRFANFMVNIFRKAALLQTGKLQHYVLYALLFLLAVFILTILGIL